MKEAARRIGITPTYGDIVQYLNKSIHVGMSRKEVEAFLQQIAPVEVSHRGELTESGGIGPHVCDELMLKIGPFFGNLRFSACYYGEGESLFNWEYKSS
jgi:hypothetical protein